jgi:multiple antibiotic resistance protein
MTREFLYNFVALFVIIDPIGSAAIFAGLLREVPPPLRHRVAWRGTLIAGLLLLAFAFGGEPLLRALGISLPAFRIAGGILLFLLATEMVFARKSGIRSTTLPEQEETAHSHDVSVFPLAFPLLAGPGAFTSIVLLMGRATSPAATATVIAALVAVLGVTLLLLLAAGQVVRHLGITGSNVVSRGLGVILAALAAQLVLDGIVQGVLHG